MYEFLIIWTLLIIAIIPVVVYSSRNMTRRLKQSTGDVRVACARKLLADVYRARDTEGVVWLNTCDGRWLHSRPRVEPQWYVRVPHGSEREAADLLNHDDATRGWV